VTARVKRALRAVGLIGAWGIGWLGERMVARIIRALRANREGERAAGLLSGVCKRFTGLPASARLEIMRAVRDVPVCLFIRPDMPRTDEL